MKLLSLLLGSALFAAISSRAADSVLVFNEIQYHPADEAAQTEWIELRSLQAVDVDIGGWRIDGGIDYAFPEGTVMPGGGHLVVAASPGQIPGSVGPWTGQLDNGGETLRLRNRNGRIMDEVSYDDEGDWPVAPDGGGVTLARRSATAAEGAAQWSPSADAGGTPGDVNFSAPGSPNVRTRVVTVGEAWRFLDTGATPGATWRNAGFDDSAWRTGATLITGGGAALAQTRPSAFPNGLLAYWSFDETTGATAANGVAGAPDGTMANGAAFVADAARGRVAEFDGANDRMEVIDPGTGLPSLTLLPAMTATNDFTWAAWVFSPEVATGPDQTSSVIMGNRTAPSGADTAPREFIKIMPTAMQYHRNAATTALDYPDLATSSWTHMCVVKRGLNLDYYRNGVFDRTIVLPGGLTNTQLPFYVGGDRRMIGNPPITLSSEHFKGRVDDVALWTRSLSAAEIGALGSGFGAAPAVLPVPPEQTTDAATGPEPRYFRKTFNFTGVPARTSLELWPAVDDGAVIYLNGNEIWRSNVPVTTEVPAPSFTSAPIVIAGNALARGTNVLSAEVHQFAGSNDLLFGAELITDQQPTLAPDAAPSLVFSEISGASDAGAFIEVQNLSASAVNIDDWVIRTSAGVSVSFPDVTVPPGGFASFTFTALGLVPLDGLRLTLFGPEGTDFHDARAVTNRLRGLTTDGRWGHPTTATAGAANIAAVSDAIVINELFYKAANDSAEQWIELHNRSAEPVDLSGWKFTDGIAYQFPANSAPLAAGGYRVVAWDPAAFTALHPGVAAAGPWSGSLSGKGELVTLRDANDNVADQLTYKDGGRWSEWADGGGSSLELRDPDADNAKGEAWDASDESSRSTWQTVTYQGPATNAAATDPPTVAHPISWNEFTLGLLNNGEILIDDISVKDVTQGNVELIQNGSFGGGTAAFWRIIGTQAGSVVDDPHAAGNKVLKIVASAETEHMHNHATTTLKNGANFHTIVATDTYSISFRAKWLRGSNALHTRLYADRLPLKTLLNRPATGGTPGAANSRFAANVGPTFEALSHSPVVPAALQPAVVKVRVADPDGVASVQLFTAINGAAFTNTAMTTDGDGLYAGTVLGQAGGALAQFYIRATDAAGAVSFFPANGPASRAMIPWEDGRAQLTLPSGAKPHNLRVLMPGADANEMYKLENHMSNASLPCTVILDEKEVYYRSGVSLKSSEHGRYQIARVGYNIEFPPDDLFLGAHGGIAIDRSGGVTTGQKEILLKRLTVSAGGIHAPEDDIIRLIPARATGVGAHYDGSGMLGAAILSKTRLKGDYLDNQWDNGGDGMMFKFERIYVLTQTINPATRVVDAAIVPENPKIPQDSTPPPGVAVVNLALTPPPLTVNGVPVGVAPAELYRWHWLVESGRDTDDFTGLRNPGTPFPLTGIVNVTTAIGQPAGATFNTEVEKYIDVSTWLRAHVPAALYGVTDNYMAPTGSGQHNALFYFPPGEKAVVFPWDMDFLAQSNPTTTTLIGGGDLPKFLANPVWKRLFYGHMLDILNRSFNTANMTRWATHYSRFGTDDMIGSVSAYLTPRADHARNVINGTGGQTAPVPVVAFARTSASPTSVSTPFATVSGTGWINVAEIRLQGSSEPLATTWTGETTWSLQLPIRAGTNTYVLVAFDRAGVQLATTSVTITGTGGIFPAGPGNLVVSELHYNPAGNSDATEFIELLNITGATLALQGCHFDEELGQGITYTFPAGSQVPAGGRILVVRDRAAFTAAYPSAGPLAPGQFTGTLDNGGESLVLYAASGVEIFRFSYADNVGPTDGEGRSLIRVLSAANPDPNSYVWRASTADGGNPGATDAVVFTGSALADADFDGLAAVMEYALGTSDGATTPPPGTLSRDAAGDLLFTFQRTVNADDVELSVVAVEDLGPGGTPISAVKQSDTTVGLVRTETWRITPAPGSVRAFAWLRATLR